MERADQEIEITVYTDPLCCWSWASEPQLKKLQKELIGRATWIYRMGGLLSSWNNFHDEVNSVSRPAQMGPVWMHAGQIANMPIQHQLWMKDPPASSYPSCVAVKCAQLQSASFGEALLEILWYSCMTEGNNIAKQQVLFDAALKLELDDSSFNFEQFKTDYSNDKGLEAFRADLDLVRYHNINRFPTLIVKARERAIMISGFRYYPDIIKAMESLIPDLNKETKEMLK